jgi:hypothetical protein
LKLAILSTSRREYVTVALGLAIAALVFFWDPLFTWPREAMLAGGDIAVMFAPWLNFIFDSVRQSGELPLWNPYLFAGIPFYANPQPMLFYPFTYLGLLLPLAQAMALTLAIHAWLGGMGMYGWLRALGASHAGAALAGLAFAFTGTFAVRLGVGHYGVALQLAWWPLSFWALHTAFERRAWRWAMWAGAPLAMALLSGHTATCLLLYVALGTYTLFTQYTARTWPGHQRPDSIFQFAYWQPCLLAAAAVVASLMLAAVQYLPLFTLSQLSVRASDPSPEFAARFAMPIGHLIALLVPNFFGQVIRTGYWSVAGYEETTYYVGVLIILAALGGIRLARQPRLAFFLCLAAGGVLLQLGPEGVLFNFFYRFVPGFALTRAPGRAGMIYTFAIITAAGLVWSEWENALPAIRARLLEVFSPFVIASVSGLTGGAIVTAFIFYATFKESGGAAWPWHMADQLSQFLILFWASLALLSAWKKSTAAPRVIHLLAALLVLFDLWSYGWYYVRPATDSLAPAWAPVAEFARQRPAWRVAAEEMEFFQLNGALAYRLRSHYGYDPLVLARYETLINSAPDYFDRVYDLLNIRFIITRNALADPRDLTVALEFTGGKIYRRPQPLPRAFVVHEAVIEPDDAQALALLRSPEFSPSRTVILPAASPCALAPVTMTETVKISREAPNHLEFVTQSSAAGLLLLSEVYYPGWQAQVDGQPVEVLRADTTLRAICLPPGAHTVRFDFWPGDLIAGAWISGVAWLALVGVVALPLGRKRS